MALRYLAPALAVAGSAAAASCSIQGTTTVTNSVQASAIAGCTTFSGSIAIATGASDIALDGIRRIEGSLVANAASQLTTLEADSLQQIDDSFTLVDCPLLTSLTFPALADVNSIHWNGLAGLQGLTFSAGIQLADSVVIENTQLGSLEGINLQMVGVIALQNNRYLNSINMQLGNISRGLIISANGRDVDLSLPNLIWANNLIIQNATTIELPSLSSVNGSIGFYSNFIDSISLPNLTTVGKEVAIVANAQLTQVSAPELKAIGGGFLISNNSDYQTASFPKVQEIGGAIDFFGTFTSVKLPDLKTVLGGFEVHSTKNINSDCSHFQSLSGPSSVIQGSYNCTGEVPHGNTGGTPTQSISGSITSSTASATTSTSSANSLLISGTTGLLGVVAAMFGML